MTPLPWYSWHKLSDAERLERIHANRRVRMDLLPMRHNLLFGEGWYSL